MYLVGHAVVCSKYRVKRQLVKAAGLFSVDNPLISARGRLTLRIFFWSKVRFLTT